MTATTARRHLLLWVRDGGEIACIQHGGAYLAFAVGNDPQARSHTTPLGGWSALTPDLYARLAADFAAAGLPAPACETCGIHPDDTDPDWRAAPAVPARSTLSVAASAVARIYLAHCEAQQYDGTEREINEAFARLGWTRADYNAALDARTSPRFAFFSGLSVDTPED